MRVLFLAAGAGGMYCGSCLRDNRLAACLLEQGRDVHLWPMYTPLKTDEPVVGETRVRFGGISVYLQQLSGVFRRAPGWVDRVLDAPRLVSWAASLSASTQPAKLGPLTVSILQGEEGRQRKELDKLIAELRGLRPDVVNLPNLMFLGQARRIKEALGCVVVCTLSGEDFFVEALPEPFRGQALALIAERAADVDAFISVTDYFAGRCVERFALPAARMHVVPMGIHAERFARTDSLPAEPFTLGYFARVVPEKGLDRLAEIFVALRRAGRTCRLRIGGYVSKADQTYLAGVLRTIADAGFADDVDCVGEVDHAGKIALLQSLHVLCVPTVYPEAKGFYVLEALAAGAAVVAPRHGSFPELIGATGGGVCYDPDDREAATEVIARWMDDRAERDRLAAAGRASVAREFTADAMADRTWAIYEALLERAPAGGAGG